MGPMTAKGVASGASAGSAFGPIGSLIGGLAGPIIGGLFGRSGQSDANAANARLAAENRAWQERMSNTAYQRSAADLEKAGLNRILAIGQPASTPAGNVATMQNKNALLAEGIKTGSAQALTARRMNAEIENIKARTDLTKAQKNAIAPADLGGQAIHSIADADVGNLIRETPNTAKYGWQQLQKYRDRISGRKDSPEKLMQDLGMNPGLLLGVLKQMDLPTMSDGNLLKWAGRNPDKVKAFIKRNRRQ